MDRSHLGYATWCAYARAQWEGGEREAALETARELVARDGRIEHRVLVATYLLELGRPDEAKKVLDAAIEDHRHAPRYVQNANHRGYRAARKLLKRCA